MNLLGSLKVLFLDSYMIAPFVFAFLVGAFSVSKNPIYLRRLSVFFCFLQLIFSSIIYMGFGELRFLFLNISFNLDKFSSILIFTVSFIFFIISIISKTFILKSHRSFWTAVFLIYGLLDVTLLTDNILVSFLNLIWVYFLNYFLNLTFSHSKDNKKDINSELKLNIFVVGVSLALILFDFLRYFILNDIEFCFSKITENLNHINPFSIFIAFSGFLILIFKMFNFVPLVGKNIENSNKINPLVVYLNTITVFILGAFLFLKTNAIFAYIYWDYQDIILSLFVFNLVYYLILSVRADSIYKFLVSVFTAYFIVNMFSIFVFSEKGNGIFVYSTIALLVAFSLFYFMLMILSDKFKTEKIEEFKKIQSKNHLTMFFIMFSILGFAGIPFLSIFSSRFAILTTLFSVEFDDTLLSFVPYVVFAGCLLLFLVVLRIYHFVLVAPVDIQKNYSELPRHQVFVLTILAVFGLIIGLFGYNTINELIMNINI